MRAITDASGSVTQTYTTDEFGVPTQTQGSSAQPFQYTGEQRDAESGFVYLRARVYDPAIGRFMQRDPLAGLLRRPLSLDRYSYVHNNPVSFIDPRGLAISQILDNDCFSTAAGTFGGYLVNVRCMDFAAGTIITAEVQVSPSVRTLMVVFFAVEPPHDGEGDGGGEEEIPATVHGAQRLRERGWTYAQYLAVKGGTQLQKADGAFVYILKVGRN